RAVACDFIDGYERRGSPRMIPTAGTSAVYLSALRSEAHSFFGFAVAYQRGHVEYGIADVFGSRFRGALWAGFRLASWPDVGRRKLSLVNLTAGAIGSVQNDYSAGWNTLGA